MTVIDPPAFEKVVAVVPGVTDVAVCVVVVVVPSDGVPVELTGDTVVVVVEVTTVGLLCAIGNVVVVTADAEWPRMAETEDFVDGPVGAVGEDEIEVVGTLQVVIAPGATGDELVAPARLRRGNDRIGRRGDRPGNGPDTYPADEGSCGGRDEPRSNRKRRHPSHASILAASTARPH